jgi:hypothetical protein
VEVAVATAVAEVGAAMAAAEKEEDLRMHFRTTITQE